MVSHPQTLLLLEESELSTNEMEKPSKVQWEEERVDMNGREEERASWQRREEKGERRR